jgi:hypothetical protein
MSAIDYYGSSYVPPHQWQQEEQHQQQQQGPGDGQQQTPEPASTSIIDRNLFRMLTLYTQVPYKEGELNPPTDEQQQHTLQPPVSIISLRAPSSFLECLQLFLVAISTIWWISAVPSTGMHQLFSRDSKAYVLQTQLVYTQPPAIQQPDFQASPQTQPYSPQAPVYSLA